MVELWWWDGGGGGMARDGVVRGRVERVKGVRDWVVTLGIEWRG